MATGMDLLKLEIMTPSVERLASEPIRPAIVWSPDEPGARVELDPAETVLTSAALASVVYKLEGGREDLDAFINPKIFPFTLLLTDRRLVLLGHNDVEETVAVMRAKNQPKKSVFDRLDRVERALDFFVDPVSEAVNSAIDKVADGATSRLVPSAAVAKHNAEVISEFYDAVTRAQRGVVRLEARLECVFAVDAYHTKSWRKDSAMLGLVFIYDDAGDLSTHAVNMLLANPDEVEELRDMVFDTVLAHKQKVFTKDAENVARVAAAVAAGRRPLVLGERPKLYLGTTTPLLRRTK